MQDRLETIKRKNKDIVEKIKLCKKEAKFMNVETDILEE